MSASLKAPFPWAGGKRRAAEKTWEALGNVDHFVDSFCGSAAMLLARPNIGRCETINDADGMVSNFWRAVKADADAVEHHATWPVLENDLHARHRWLIGQRESLTERLEADPDYYDAKIAGWWCWGASAWIGFGWCGDVANRQLPFFGNTGMGVHSRAGAQWKALRDRLANVDVASGDWKRVVTPTVLFRASGVTGLFFDPPYKTGAMQYAAGGTGTAISDDVRAWCLENGANPRLRIVLAGYDDDHDALLDAGWRRDAWNAKGSGYVGKGEERENQKRERLWMSPHCEQKRQLSLGGL